MNAPINSRLGRRIQWCDFWDARGAEILNAFILLGWGSWLFLPATDAFNICPRSYTILEALLTASWWGSVAIFLGLLKFYVIWRDELVGRKWLALICGVYWFIVSVSVGASEWRSKIFPLMMLLTFNMFRVFFCIKTIKQNE